MDPIARAALSSWDWRPEVIVTILVLGSLFLVGWRRLRAISGPAKTWRSLGARWRPIFYIIGLLVIGFALMSPLDVLVQQLFFMHMIQHLLLIMVAPVFLLLPNPMPFVLWGLPPRAAVRTACRTPAEPSSSGSGRAGWSSPTRATRACRCGG